MDAFMKRLVSTSIFLLFLNQMFIILNLIYTWFNGQHRGLIIHVR